VSFGLGDETLKPENIAFPLIPNSGEQGSAGARYKNTTPLAIELRRQAYETNKDLEAIPSDAGWEKAPASMTFPKTLATWRVRKNAVRYGMSGYAPME
jgi:hypothetical protein